MLKETARALLGVCYGVMGVYKVFTTVFWAVAKVLKEVIDGYYCAVGGS